MTASFGTSLKMIKKTIFAGLFAFAMASGYSSTASAAESVADANSRPVVSEVQRPEKEEEKKGEEKKKEKGQEPEEKNEFRKTSLLEATVYTGLPALTVSSLALAYHADQKGKRLTLDKVLDNYAWGFQNPPVWDKNPWYVNYVGHPIAGSESYLLARNRAHSPLVSFLYSTLISATWEYGIECSIGARPSRQDLIFTSTLGSVLGELRYQAKKRLMRNEESTLNSIGIVILDPIDAVYRALE